MGICVAGGPANPLCDAAIIINACKWIVIGGVSIMLSGDNPQCDAANDDNCEPEDPCKKKFQDLKGLWLGIRDKANKELSKKILRKLAEAYNKERDDFIKQCPDFGAPPKMNVFNPFN